MRALGDERAQVREPGQVEVFPRDRRHRKHQHPVDGRTIVLGAGGRRRTRRGNETERDDRGDRQHERTADHNSTFVATTWGVRHHKRIASE